MATKPTVVPQWDTTNTNSTEPLSGEKATGWGLDSFIVSSYLNWWMGLIYAWFAYMHGARWFWQIPAVSPAQSHYALTNSGYTAGGTNYDGATEYGVINLSVDNLSFTPLNVPVGETLYAIAAWYKGGGGANSGIQVWRKSLTTGATSLVGTLAMPTAVSYSLVTLTLGTPEPIDGGFVYWYDIISILASTQVRAVGLLRGEVPA